MGHVLMCEPVVQCLFAEESEGSGVGQNGVKGQDVNGSSPAPVADPMPNTQDLFGADSSYVNSALLKMGGGRRSMPA